ncbi:hypothetical protein ACFOYW_00805 [Gryllotalpicola reticulitermitis]|uniref:Mannosyltransferase (PIG-V) n=1 Tax=Gryllotalpicola reticulitermitis TaxID=1184153 RepID=A0ABV8Q3H0_9MICO
MPLTARWCALPWWARVTAMFLAGRVLDTLLLLWQAAIEGANAWTGAHPRYLDFANIWDGRWYQTVEQFGYPRELQFDPTGHVLQNQWAFLPVYPYIVKGLIFVTTMSWELAAVIVSVVCAWGATMMFYKLMRTRLRPSTAMYATVLFSIAPVAALYQVAYAESMFELLLVVILYLWVKRRFWLMLPFIVVAAFTRPGEVALALALGLWIVWRLWRAWRGREPMRMPELTASVIATLVAFVAGLAWPVIAGHVTGYPSAYTQTELSWRASYTGWGPLVPFTPWFEAAKWWFTLWLHTPAWVGYLTLVVLILLFAAFLLIPPARRLGMELRLWLAAYGLYVLAVFFPQSSTFRILLPMFPALGVIAAPRARWYRIGMVVVFVAAQVGWLLLAWTIGDYDWSPP